MNDNLDIELRREAVRAAVQATSARTPEIAADLYEFLTAAGPSIDDQLQPLIDAERATWPGKGYDQVHDDEQGREHLLVQAMQYELKGRHAAALALLQQAAKTPHLEGEPQLGDTVATIGGLKRMPIGTVLIDRDGDRHTLTETGWRYRYDAPFPVDSEHNVIKNYLPATIDTLPTN